MVQNITQLPEIPSIDNYFDVKPNPFNDELHISFGKESAKDEKIKIIALNGIVIHESYARSKKEMVISTSGLLPGTYLLVVSHGQEKYVRKIIKSNIY